MPTRDGVEFQVVVPATVVLDEVVLSVQGADKLGLGAQGQLIAYIEGRELEISRPIAIMKHGGEERRIPIEFKLVSSREFTFGGIVATSAEGMTIDPGMRWSSGIGGSGSDQCTSIARDSRGRIVVGGTTYSIDFPVTPGAFQGHPSLGAGTDGFVAIIDPSLPRNQQLVYATYFGGSEEEANARVAVGVRNTICVAFDTASRDLVTSSNAYDRTHNGLGLSPSYDFAFAIFDDSSGAYRLTYCSYLGGRSDEFLGDMFADGARIFLTGATYSDDYPTTSNAWRTASPSPLTCCVSVIVPGAGQQLLYSTYFGGTVFDTGICVRPMGASRICVAGNGASPDFPATAAWLGPRGDINAFLAILDYSASPPSQVQHAIVIGGQGEDAPLALDQWNEELVAIGGYTAAPDFPVAGNAISSLFGGGEDGFIAVFGLGAGLTRIYASYIGGLGLDEVAALALRSPHRVDVFGSSYSLSLPTTVGSFQLSHKNASGGVGPDGFVLRLDPTVVGAQQVVYGTYLGGNSSDKIVDGIRGSGGDVLVCGWTGSSNYPFTSNAWAGDDALSTGFVSMLDMMPQGIESYGNGSNGCFGSVECGAPLPRVGSPAFALSCIGAPSSGFGLLILGMRGDAPLSFFGCDLWIDLSSQPVSICSAHADRGGFSLNSLPIPAQQWLVGQRIAAQYVWLDSLGSSTCQAGTVSASNAIEITIQL